MPPPSPPAPPSPPPTPRMRLLPPPPPLPPSPARLFVTATWVRVRLPRLRMPPPSAPPEPSPPGPPGRIPVPFVPLAPAAPSGARPPVIVRRSSVTVAPAATDSTRSPRPVASITVAVAPVPMIVSGVEPVTFRSPVASSSAPAGAIDKVYVPAPSTIVFDTMPAARNRSRCRANWPPRSPRATSTSDRPRWSRQSWCSRTAPPQRRRRRKPTPAATPSRTRPPQHAAGNGQALQSPRPALATYRMPSRVERPNSATTTEQRHRSAKQKIKATDTCRRACAHR